MSGTWDRMVAGFRLSCTQICYIHITQINKQLLTQMIGFTITLWIGFTIYYRHDTLYACGNVQSD